MKRYAISCDSCGSYEQGIAYPNETIQHTHTWVYRAPVGTVQISVAA